MGKVLLLCTLYVSSFITAVLVKPFFFVMVFVLKQFSADTVTQLFVLFPDMNALFNRLCVNYEGKVCNKKKKTLHKSCSLVDIEIQRYHFIFQVKLISKHKGVLHKVLLQVRQVNCSVYFVYE